MQSQTSVIVIKDGSHINCEDVSRVVERKKKLVGVKKIGEYTMLKTPLGSGASGNVKRAVSKDGRHVAMKVVALPVLLEDREYQLSKLHMETHCMNLCQGHPNILCLEKAMMSEQNFFFITEEAPMGDIFDFIAQRGLFPERSVKEIFKQLMLAVAHMHQCGVGHRDLKPENILLFPNETIKVCDFGFAIEWKEEDGLMTKSLGTVRCLPPEMIRTSAAKQPRHNPFQADIWSSGVVLFYLLTGRFPFDGPTEQDTLKNIVKRRFTRTLPHDYVAMDLITKMLKLEPRERLSAKQVLAHPYFTQSV